MKPEKKISQHWNPRSGLWCYLENGRIKKTSESKFDGVPVTKGKEAYQKPDADDKEQTKEDLETDKKPQPEDSNSSGIGMF